MQPDQNRDPWERRGIEGVTGQPGVPDWTTLTPFGVAAFGTGTQQVQRMLELQGALARGVDLIAAIRRPTARSVAALGGTWLASAGALARRCLGLSPSDRLTGQHP